MLSPSALADVEREACKTYEDFRAALARMDAAVDEIAQAAAAFMEHPLDWTLEVLDLLAASVEAIAQALGEDGDLRKLAISYMLVPSQSGAVLGVVAANVVIIALPGVGEEAELAEAARVIKLAAQEAEAEAQLAKASSKLAESELPAELAGLLRRIRIALRLEKLTLHPSITDHKYQVFRKLAEYGKLGRQVALLARERIAIAVHTLWGLPGSFSSLENVSQTFNAHSQVIYLLELERQGTIAITEAEAAAHTVTLAEQVFDRAHLVDDRFFEFFSDEARAVLKWPTSDDMPAILATASEHQRSWPQYFKSFEKERGPAALPEVLNELKSITNTFKSKLIKIDAAGKPLPGQPTPAPDAVFIGPRTHKASEIVQLHIELWTKHHLSVANRGGLQKLQELLAALKAANM